MSSASGATGGGRLDMGGVVRRTLLVLRRQAGPLLLMGLLTVGLVMMMFGGLRLSGIIVESDDPWARWVAAVPAGVVEDRQAMRAMERSARLTKNHRGAIILLGVAGLLFYVVVVLVVSVFGAALGLFGLEPVVTELVMVPLLTTFLAVLTYVGKTVIYAELAGVAEHGSVQDLLEVFA